MLDCAREAALLPHPCPRCGHELETQTYEDVWIDGCPNCDAIVVGRDDLLKLIAKRTGPTDAPARPPRAPTPPPIGRTAKPLTPPPGATPQLAPPPQPAPPPPPPPPIPSPLRSAPPPARPVDPRTPEPPPPVLRVPESIAMLPDTVVDEPETEETEEATQSSIPPLPVFDVEHTEEATNHAPVRFEFGAATDHGDDEDEGEATPELPVRRSGSSLPVILGGAAVLVVAMAVVVVVALWQLGVFAGAPEQAAGPKVAPATPEPPVAAAAEAPKPDPEPAPKPKVDEPKPAPKAKAPAPKKASASSLIDQGWNAVSSDPTGAAALFEKALAAAPGNDDAAYGLGYALLQTNDAAGAKPHLCAASDAKSVDTRREVQALLERHGLTCP